ESQQPKAKSESQQPKS
ncbi:uncharacterized protein TNIN_31861, partial [Trichonephila inaurata madagascariensis]